MLSDGAVQSYWAAGANSAASAPVVVCLHGWGMSGQWFEGLAEAVADRYPVVVPDLRGHGNSQTGNRPLTIDLLAKDLHFFLESAGCGEVVLVAWSMGAMVAWKALELGLNATVAGLVVIDMSPRIINDDGWSLGLSRAGGSASNPGLSIQSLQRWETTSRRIAERILSPVNAESPLVGQLAADVARNDPHVLSDLWQSMLGQDFRSAIASLPVRTLVLYGQHSQLYQPAVSEYLCENAPNATRVGFDRSGHAPHLEQPEKFNESVSAFLADCLADSAVRRPPTA